LLDVGTLMNKPGKYYGVILPMLFLQLTFIFIHMYVVKANNLFKPKNV
jgi:uncharacterized membrane protein (DUF485 family)